MSFTKQKAERLYEKLRAREPNTPGVLGVPPNGVGAGVIGSVALGTGAATTTDVTDARIVPGRTACLLEAADLYGSAEKGAGNIWVDFPADGIARIHHTASTKTRTFTYLLMFGLAFLLGTAAFGQVIQDDGVPLEVRPALNFTTDISCANVGDGTDCQVAGSIGAGDVMLASVWATVFGYPYTDFTHFALAADAIDSDEDGLAELTCTPPFTCAFDPDEDGVSGVFFNDASLTVGETGVGPLSMTSGILSGGFQAANGDLQVGRGLRVGSATLGSISTGNSACVGRSPTSDKLFEDTDCDFQAGTNIEPEVAPSTVTNSEAFLIDMQRRLSADVSTDGAGAANDTTGIQATGLKLDLDWIGAYWIEYQILSRTSVAGDGIKYGVEYTGTETSLYCHRTHLSNSTTAADDTADDVDATPAQVVEGYAASAASTTAPNLGPNVGGYTTTNTTLERISCNLLTSTAGDLTFFFGSEVDGTAVTVKANSMVKATPFP